MTLAPPKPGEVSDIPSDPAQGPSLRRRFLSGTFWILLSNIIINLLRLPAAIITTRLLNPAAYGDLGIITSTVGMFDQVSRLRLGITTTRYVAEYRKSNPKRAQRIIGLTSLVGFGSGLLAMIVVYFCSGYLASNQLHKPELATLIAAASLLLFFNGMMGPQDGALSGLEAFRTLSITSIITNIISLAVRLTGLYYWGLPGLVYGIVVATAFDWLIDRWAMVHELKKWKIPISYRNVTKESSVLWHMSLPATLSALIVAPVIWIANALLVRMPSGDAELGIFNAATHWQGLIGNVPQVLGTVLFPLLAAHARDHEPRLDALNILLPWLLTALLALPLITFPESVQFLYGNAYRGPAYAHSLVLIMFFSCLEAYNSGIMRKLQASGLVWWGFMSNVVWGVVLIGCMMFLRDRGAVGLGISYAVAYLVKNLIFLPFHLVRGVVPARLLLNPWTGLIWGSILALGIVALADASFIKRGVLFCLLLPIVGYGLYALWQEGNQQKINPGLRTT